MTVPPASGSLWRTRSPTETQLHRINSFDKTEEEITLAQRQEPSKVGSAIDLGYGFWADSLKAMAEKGTFGWCLLPFYRLSMWLAHLEEPERDSWLARFVLSRGFEFICAMVIIFNSFEAASAANFEVEHGDQATSAFVMQSERYLCIFYTGELLMKLSVHGLFFFCNMDWKWNCFDAILVMQAVYEQFMLLIVTEAAGGNMAFMRAFRIMKMSKIFRVLRVIRIFRELRLMMISIMNSFISLFWTMIMLFFILYIFGLVTMQGVSSYVNDAETGRQRRVSELMHDHFGSVSVAMLSFYKAGTGGADWEISYNIISEAGAFYAAIFIFYTAFFQFAVFNVLTGMFVEKVMKLAEPDQEATVLQWKQEKRAQVAEVKKMCKEIDKEGDGCITWQMFQEAMAEPAVLAYFASLDLDLRDAEVFFKTLCYITESPAVDIDAFVDGCMRMRGTASSLDLHILSVQAQLIQRNQRDFFDHAASLLSDLILTQQGLCKSIEAPEDRTRLVTPT